MASRELEALLLLARLSASKVVAAGCLRQLEDSCERYRCVESTYE